MKNWQTRSAAGGRRRGVTLIEAVLYVAVALALIIGGLIFFQQATLSARVSQATRLLASLSAETRVLIGEDPVINPNLNATVIEEALFVRGSVPANSFDSTQIPSERIRNPWNAPLQVFISQGFVIGAADPNRDPRSFSMIMRAIPVEACTRLAAINVTGVSSFTTNTALAVVQDDENDADFGLPVVIIRGPTESRIFPGDSASVTSIACRGQDSNGNGLVNLSFTLGTSN